MTISKVTIQQAALACLLFFAVFHTFKSFLDDIYFVSLCFSFLSIWLSKHLISAKQGRKLNSDQSIAILIAIWLVLTGTFSQQPIYSVGIFNWLPLLMISSHILLIDRELNKVSAALFSALIINLFFSTLESQLLIQQFLTSLVFLLLLNFVTRYILQLQQDLKIANTKDLLTGCSNLTVLNEEITKAVALHSRYGTKVSAIQLDLRYQFPKRHLLESCIKEVAQICESRLRQTDTLCRQSDFRFIILLPSTEKVNAQILAEDLIKACDAYNFSFMADLKSADNNTHRPVFAVCLHEYSSQESSEAWFHQLTS